MQLAVNISGNPEALSERLPAKILANVHLQAVEAALQTQDEMREVLNQPGSGIVYRIAPFKGAPKGVAKIDHQASAPGEPPAKRYGELRQSIMYRVRVLSHGVIEAVVGTPKDYGRKLQTGFSDGPHYTAPRPWVSIVFDKLLPRIRERFRRAIGGFGKMISRKF